MTIVIEDEEAEALLTALAAASGREMPEVILDLLRKAAAHDLKGEERVAARRRLMEELSQRYRARLRGPMLPHEEIIGYDEDGLPA
jgi:hypothetical protein